MNWIRAIVRFLYERVFGCSHDRLTRPFTLKQQTYKVCLDCGKQVDYSVEDMRPLSPREIRRTRMARTKTIRVHPVLTWRYRFLNSKPAVAASQQPMAQADKSAVA